jgi:hypothetical protein
MREIKVVYDLAEEELTALEAELRAEKRSGTGYGPQGLSELSKRPAITGRVESPVTT